MTEAQARRDAGDSLRVGSHRLSVREQIREVVEYRELLVGMIRRELKVKYKNSTLGFLWSLLNPALQLGVYYIVFQHFLGAGVPNFAVFLLCGLLIWNLVGGSMAIATSSVTGAGPLVNKVYFPRTILPLAAVGAQIVHFFLQGIVLILVLLASRSGVAWAYAPALVPAFIAAVLLAAGLSILLSAVNVYARDTQHLLELALLAWFWLTPIVYPADLILRQLEARPSLPDWLYLLNPVTPIVMTFQRVLHNQTTIESEAPLREGGVGAEIVITRILPDYGVAFYLATTTAVIAVSALLIVAALRLFSRLEGSFAEEI
jgi:ABC-2 type transport system permease protein